MSCKVSFIGLGVMGYPMAGFISKGGHDVTVYNRTKEKAEKWVSEYKGQTADTPSEAAKESDFIFTCVGNDDDLREVAIGKDGLFNSAKKNSVYVDNTTASAIIARKLYASAKAHGWGFLDAPISGGQADSFAHYRQLVGLVQGIEWSRNNLTNIVKKNMYEEDD